MQNNGIGASSDRVGSINTDTNRALIDGQDKTESSYSRFKVSVSGGEKLLPAENNNLKYNQSPNLKSRVCVQSDHLERMIPTSKQHLKELKADVHQRYKSERAELANNLKDIRKKFRSEKSIKKNNLKDLEKDISAHKKLISKCSKSLNKKQPFSFGETKSQLENLRSQLAVLTTLKIDLENEINHLEKQYNQQVTYITGSNVAYIAGDSFLGKFFVGMKFGKDSQYGKQGNLALNEIKELEKLDKAFSEQKKMAKSDLKSAKISIRENFSLQRNQLANNIKEIRRSFDSRIGAKRDEIKTLEGQINSAKDMVKNSENVKRDFYFSTDDVNYQMRSAGIDATVRELQSNIEVLSSLKQSKESELKALKNERFQQISDITGLNCAYYTGDSFIGIRFGKNGHFGQKGALAMEKAQKLMDLDVEFKNKWQ